MPIPKAELTPMWRQPNSRGYAGYSQKLAGFGSYSGFGEFLVVTPGKGSFQNSWTNDDWTSANRKWKDHINYWFKLSYEPLDEGVLDRARVKGDKLLTQAKEGDIASGALLGSLADPIFALIKRADANTSQFDNLGNASDATHRDRFAIFNSLNQAITRLANATIPAFVPPSDGTSPLPGSKPPSSVYEYQAQQIAAAQAAAKAAAAAAAKAKADALANVGNRPGSLAPQNNSKMLIFGGIGLAALLGVGLVLSKKKKAAV